MRRIWIEELQLHVHRICAHKAAPTSFKQYLNSLKQKAKYAINCIITIIYF